MATIAESPRQLAEGVYWLTDCLVMEHEGETIHAYSSAYLVHGDERSMIVDTGHPKDWASIEAQLDRLEAIGIPPIEYIFPTHAEVPHAANLGRLLNKYPDLIAVGDVRDYHLFFPSSPSVSSNGEAASRSRSVARSFSCSTPRSRISSHHCGVRHAEPDALPRRWIRVHAPPSGRRMLAYRRRGA